MWSVVGISPGQGTFENEKSSKLVERSHDIHQFTHQHHLKLASDRMNASYGKRSNLTDSRNAADSACTAIPVREESHLTSGKMGKYHKTSSPI